MSSNTHFKLTNNHVGETIYIERKNGRPGSILTNLDQKFKGEKKKF